MSRPGVDVISRALPPPRSAPTDTGVCFIVGDTETTDVPYALIRSLTEYETVFGPRGTAPGQQATYDAVEVYFQEGGSQCYVGSTTSTITFTHVAPNKPSDDELAGMTRDELDVLAVSLGLDSSAYATKAEVVEAIDAAAPLAVDTGIATALAALTKDLGPGQILVADPAKAGVADTHSALLAHAVQTNRVALLSCADGDAAALEAVGTAVQSDPNARYGALFMPSAIVPGIVAGSTRTVPYTAVQAGIIARNDVQNNPNIPAAGDMGQSVFATDLVNRYSDADYSALNEASVNMARIVYGGIRTYGYRSCVDAETVPQWEDFGWARLNMAIVAQSEVVGESFVFAQIDGRGLTIAQFGSALGAMLVGFYNDDALYGETPQAAFSVDVGDSVNTEETIANGELHAVLSVRMSGMAEWVVIEIVKVATNQALPAVAA